jgi:hypothetical protein
MSAASRRDSDPMAPSNHEPKWGRLVTCGRLAIGLFGAFAARMCPESILSSIAPQANAPETSPPERSPTARLQSQATHWNLRRAQHTCRRTRFDRMSQRLQTHPSAVMKLEPLGSFSPPSPRSPLLPIAARSFQSGRTSKGCRRTPARIDPGPKAACDLLHIVRAAGALPPRVFLGLEAKITSRPRWRQARTLSPIPVLSQYLFGGRERTR